MYNVNECLHSSFKTSLTPVSLKCHILSFSFRPLEISFCDSPAILTSQRQCHRRIKVLLLARRTQTICIPENTSSD
jgi:hypothetical protein